MRILYLASLAASFCASTALKLHIASQNASAASSTLTSAVKQTSQDLVFDFGFFNGMDSWNYLSQAAKVVAVEADPTLIADANANANFLPFIQNGQLTLLNLAIAPLQQDADSQLPFYLNKCTKEWNSFYPGIGCRSCTAPHAEDPTKASCTTAQVTATPCASVFAQHGTPKYAKLDIEGAEAGCYHAIRQNPAYRPAYLSAEVGHADLVDTLIGLGYKSFKLVRQQNSVSGQWGDGALDCRTAKLWRSQEGARQELAGIFTKAPDPNDPCPSTKVGGAWYDVHASVAVHQTW